MMRKGILLLVLFFMFSVSSLGQTEISEKAAIARAKQVSVSRLDSKLPKQRFDSWLVGLIGKEAKIFWDVNDCGETTGTAVDKERDMPICVGVEAALTDRRKLMLLMAVGTQKRGLFGYPSGFHVSVIEQGERYLQINELSELPEKLKIKDIK
jgi:hypothetical protein